MKVDDNLNLLRTVMDKKGETVISVLSAFHRFWPWMYSGDMFRFGYWFSTTECQYFDVTYVKQNNIHYKWNIFCTHTKIFFGKKKVFTLFKNALPTTKCKDKSKLMPKISLPSVRRCLKSIIKMKSFLKVFLCQNTLARWKKAREEILHKMLSVSKKWLNTSESPFSIHFFASECSNAAVWKFYNFSVTYVDFT